jgi:hypothetical protein
MEKPIVLRRLMRIIPEDVKNDDYGTKRIMI